MCSEKSYQYTIGNFLQRVPVFANGCQMHNLAEIQCISALLNRPISDLFIAEESFALGQAESI